MFLEIVQCVLLAFIAICAYGSATRPIPWIDQDAITDAVADGIALAREREEKHRELEASYQP